MAQDAGPDETAAFIHTLRDDLRARVARFAAWPTPEQTIWLLRRLGITVLLTGRQRSWIASPTVWVVSQHAPLDQVNRLLVETAAHTWRTGGTPWERLDLMLFLILGMPFYGDAADHHRELCRLVGFADRTTLLRRFARRALRDGPWVYDSRYGRLRTTLESSGYGQVRASVTWDRQTWSEWFHVVHLAFRTTGSEP